MCCACLGVQIKIDNEQDRNGTLYEAYDFLLPRQIKVHLPSYVLSNRAHPLQLGAQVQSCPFLSEACVCHKRQPDSPPPPPVLWKPRARIVDGLGTAIVKNGRMP